MSVCDHTSVGIIVYKGDSMLLIERKKFPFGFAAPAGHRDGDPDFETAAKRELEEETGLLAETLKLLLDKRVENPCRREDGTWHQWKIFRATVSGNIKPNQDEVKGLDWYSHSQILNLASKTELFRAGSISKEEWETEPGLEPVWYDFLKTLEII
jgi:8-oxo-dGTP pyrophosphatase MutT (NUDIX family)